ncbi:MAG: hypothetical protein ACR2GQ_02120 [Gemmatimonadota bacterium]
MVGCASGGGYGGSGNGSDTEPTVVPSGDAQFNREIASGTQFEVQLQQTLSTKTTKPGDRWSGVVSRDVTDGQHVLLQRGSVVTGEVTKSGNVEMDGESRKVLALNPNKLEVGGQTYTISADVVKAKTKNNRDLVTGENIAIVGGGALAGTLLGELLLDNAALGAILGAAGGSAVAVARSDTDIELEQGTVLTLELDRAVRPAASS